MHGLVVQCPGVEQEKDQEHERVVPPPSPQAERACEDPPPLRGPLDACPVAGR